MSIVGDAIGAIRDALKLADDVKRAAETLKAISMELRDQDRRITRLEAKWEAAVQLATGRATPRRIARKT